jgi:FixJ family two-component response regulator
LFTGNAALSQSPLIAIVDDDASICEAIQALLRASGFLTEAFSSAEDFLQSTRLHEMACLVTDLQLRGMSGLQLQRQLGQQNSTIPIIVITAFPSEGLRAMAAGALCVLDKPVSKEDLLACIGSALQRRQGHGPA